MFKSSRGGQVGMSNGRKWYDRILQADREYRESLDRDEKRWKEYEKQVAAIKKRNLERNQRARATGAGVPGPEGIPGPPGRMAKPSWAHCLIVALAKRVAE